MFVLVDYLVGVIIFGSVRILSKQVTKPKKTISKKNRHRFKPTSFGSVWFFRTKIGFAWFFVCLARFFCFFYFGSVRFGFFGFRLIKTNHPVF